MKPYYKPRLPNWLSFPIGVQTLESAFDGIRQLEELDVNFHQQYGVSATEFRRVIASGKPHLIASARFDRWDKRPSIGMSERDRMLRGVWSLQLYPVARQKKSAARALLIEEGLPILRQWFEASRPESWYWGRKRCNVLFDPLELILTSDDIVDAV